MKLPNGTFIKARVMIDSGAAGNFMNLRFSLTYEIPTIQKDRVTPLVGLNNELLNAGIIHHTRWINMIIGNHLESICFDITELGQYDVIIGILWLRKHGLRIDWRRDEIYFDYCECPKTKDTWTGREPPSTKGPSSGTVGTYRDPYEGELKRSQRPRGRALGRIMDVDVLVTTEQGPDMSDDELREYIMIHYELQQTLCATGEGIQIPAEY